MARKVISNANAVLKAERILRSKRGPEHDLYIHTDSLEMITYIKV